MLPLWSLNGSTNVAAGLPVPFNAFDFSDPNDSCQHSGDASEVGPTVQSDPNVRRLRR